jgi:glutathione S-transferase
MATLAGMTEKIDFHLSQSKKVFQQPGELTGRAINLLSSFVIYASLSATANFRRTLMRYELYYQPSIQGRGEFIRLSLEDAGADYIDVARDPNFGRPGIMRFLEDPSLEHPPFAPPFLKAGKLLISQTANILQFLAPRLGLVPKSEASRLWTHQLQLTIADWLYETGQTHHPIANVLYYEQQTDEAKKRAANFTANRIPKFLGYFERILKRNAKGGDFVFGKKAAYVDLSLFQMVEGLRYAFPKTMERLESQHPRMVSLHDRVMARSRIAAYLSSPRRLAFNEQDIFRHYPELEQE